MTARASVAARRDAEALLDLARRVRRLRPCWRDPRLFYAQRDDIEHDLARLAAEAQRREGRPC